MPKLLARRRVREDSTVENCPILGEPWEDIIGGGEKKKGKERVGNRCHGTRKESCY
jgi:hypothetical protein